LWWPYYIFPSRYFISKAKFDLISFPGRNYFLKFKILWWPYYVFPSHYLFGTSSRWYPKENLQKRTYKLKYPSWTLQFPLNIPHVHFETQTHLKISQLWNTQKNNPTHKLMTSAFESQARVLFYLLSTSSFFFIEHEFLFFIEPTLKNWFSSNCFGPFNQGTKWHMKTIIKTNEKQVYSHFPMKLN
jgi:hypothetical protein